MPSQQTPRRTWQCCVVTKCDVVILDKRGPSTHQPDVAHWSPESAASFHHRGYSKNRRSRSL